MTCEGLTEIAGVGSFDCLKFSIAFASARGPRFRFSPSMHPFRKTSGSFSKECISAAGPKRVFWQTKAFSSLRLAAPFPGSTRAIGVLVHPRVIRLNARACRTNGVIRWLGFWFVVQTRFSLRSFQRKDTKYHSESAEQVAPRFGCVA